MQNSQLVIDRQWFIGAIAAAVIVDVLSLAVYTLPSFQWPIFVLLIVLIISLTVRDSRWLVILPLAELAWGSFGSSFQWFIGDVRVTLRMLLFILCMLVGIFHYVQERRRGRLISRQAVVFISALLVPVAWAVFRGVILSNDPLALFLDANGYLYVLYAALWVVIMPRMSLQPLISAMGGIITALALKTLILLNVFVHGYEMFNVRYLYLWVRDTRIGEITPLVGSVYRVFIQSQLYIALTITAVATYILRFGQRLPTSLLIWGSLLFSAFIVSFSRSFWLGVAASTIISIVVWYAAKQATASHIGNFLIRMSAVALGGFALTFLVVTLPYAGFRDISGLLFSRVATVTSDEAGTSRMQQLAPLASAIGSHLFLGSGFGARVTYPSNDPRIKDSDNPQGLVTTYAFEWGYLDQLLKMGVAAFSIYFAALVYLAVRCAQRAVGEASSLVPAVLFVTLICLMITHITSPYLNHPLGLGVVALVIAIASRDFHNEPA